MTPTEALLAQLRVLSAESRHVTFAIDEVGIMLASGHISPQGALYWAWCNGIDLVGTDDEAVVTGGRAA
jgi:hypothetical protein